MNPTAPEASRQPAVDGTFAALATPVVPTKTVLLDGGDVESKRAEIRRYFHQTCEIYERLLGLNALVFGALVLAMGPLAYALTRRLRRRA